MHRVYRLLSLQKPLRKGSSHRVAVFGTGLAFRSYDGQAAAADGLRILSICKTWNSFNSSSVAYSSTTRSLYLMLCSDYMSSKKIKRIESKTLSQFKRLFSGGATLLDSGALWMLIGANVGVLTMWHHLDYRFMQKHFAVSIDSVLCGRVYTILTSAFSQYDPSHLLSNMIGLYFMGSEIARIFGGKYLLTVYLAGAVGGSLGHMLYHGFVYPWLQGIPSRFYDLRRTPGAMGASGAVTSVMLLFIFLYPKHVILFKLFIPMPAALVGAIIIGKDLWLAKQGDTDISVGGHLGGAVVAVLAFLATKSHWF